MAKTTVGYPYLERKRTEKNVQYAVVFGPRKKSKFLKYKKDLLSAVQDPKQPLTNYQRALLERDILAKKDIKYQYGTRLVYKPEDSIIYHSKKPELREIDPVFIGNFINANLLIEFESPNDKFFFFSNQDIFSAAFTTKRGAQSAILHMHTLALESQINLTDDDLEYFISLAHKSPDVTGEFSSESALA